MWRAREGERDGWPRLRRRLTPTWHHDGSAVGRCQVDGVQWVGGEAEDDGVGGLASEKGEEEGGEGVDFLWRTV